MSILATRRSIRKYLNKDVSNELIEKIILEAMEAPSSRNLQPWKYLVVRDKEKQKEIVKLDNNQEWMLEAPIFIVCLGDASTRFDDITNVMFDDDAPDWPFKQIIRDMGIGITYLSLAIEQNGLGSCWTGWYDQKQMKQLLDVPNHLFVAGILSVGYPAETPPKRPRKQLRDVIMYETIINGGK